MCVYTNINTCIKCNYVFSDKSSLRLVVNKKSPKTLSAFLNLSNNPLS